MRRYTILTVLAVLALVSCNNGGQGGSGSGGRNCGLASLPSKGAKAPEASTHQFPAMSLPLVYGDDPAAAREYTLEHFWDAFFSQGGPTTDKTILGVADGEVEQALANYIAVLNISKELATPENTAPLKQAQKSVGTLFSKIERTQKADTSSHVFARMTELVSKYLYDPNSPMRDEDLYLPFAEAARTSPCTPDDMRAAYNYEAKQCRTNTFGSVAPDFKYSDAGGRKGSLHGVSADYTMLFFSNPGCNSCKEIINEVLSRDYVSRYIADGKLAIVNIYIDEEISKWRDYLPNYPKDWINGYDYTFQLRDSGKYDIRAIPSLYLLDSSKRVLMKDAPTERVLSFLDTI